jgi:hypothetical protein
MTGINQQRHLTQEEIIELDGAIDACVPSFPLLSRSRDVALINLLRYFDGYMAACAAIPDSGQRETAHHDSSEGLHHAVRWIFQFCPPNRGRPNLSLDEDAYIQATDIHSAARQYSKVWDILSMLRRGILIGVKNQDGVIRVRFSSEIAKEMDVAEKLIAAPYDPEVYAGEPIVTPEIRELIIHKVKILAGARHTLRYSIPNDLFELLSERIDRMTYSLWELDPDWDLEGYTFAQLRKRWTALNVLCLAHSEICYRFYGTEKVLEAMIRFMKRRYWEKEIAQRACLPREVVSAILSDLIYDPAISRPGKKQAHVTFQPFIPLGLDILAVSDWLVHWINIERNVWELISIKRPDLHSKLRNLKEGTWIKELQKRGEALGLKVYPPIKFKFGERRGDLDSLILDERARFGLVCQLKWLTIPGRIAQGIYNDKEIEKGIIQAQSALAWVTSNPPQLRGHTGLSSDELRQYEFKPLVMCKRPLPSGLLGRTDVPVINERLFDRVLGEPHRQSLPVLWQVADDLRYLPQYGKHYEDFNGSVEFGGFRFEGDGIGYILKEPWDPASDINLEGLS